MDDFPRQRQVLELFFQRTKSKTRQGPLVAVEMHITSSQNCIAEEAVTPSYQHTQKDNIWFFKDKRYKTLRLQVLLADAVRRHQG
jgi:hypothetical protein